MNKYAELFNKIMDTLFDGKDNKTFSFYKGNYKSIPEEIGIYTTIRPDNFEIKLLSQSPKKVKQKGTIKYPHKPSEKFEDVNPKYLYIGKANGQKGKRKGLNQRISTYVQFVCCEKDIVTIAHRGGDGIFYIKNNKELTISYATIFEIKKHFNNELYLPAEKLYRLSDGIIKNNNIPQIIETGLNELHRWGYKHLPYTNNESDETTPIIYKNYWRKYWEENIDNLYETIVLNSDN